MEGIAIKKRLNKSIDLHPQAQPFPPDRKHNYKPLRLKN